MLVITISIFYNNVFAHGNVFGRLKQDPFGELAAVIDEWQGLISEASRS